MKRPEIVEDEHLGYLDELRAWGATNMFGARPYLMEEYPELTSKEAQSILLYWMDSFSERNPC